MTNNETTNDRDHRVAKRDARLMNLDAAYRPTFASKSDESLVNYYRKQTA
jgi:hypothetical protein